MAAAAGTLPPLCIFQFAQVIVQYRLSGPSFSVLAQSDLTAPVRALKLIQRKKPPSRITAERWLFLKEKAGTYLFSQVVSNQLSSAQQSLTSVFGMGTGGTSASSAPAKYASSLAFTYSLLPKGCTLKTEYYCELANGVPKDCGQALDLLVHAS